MAEQTPDSIITTQKNGQTIVAELFFNHSGTETFRDKLLKVILADSLQSRRSRKSGKCGRKSKKPRGKRAAPTTGSIQGSTGRETLKSNGNMTA